MNQRIIYANNDGGITVIIPASDCGLTIKQIASKDVPAGVPYLILDAADIPADRTFRNAWDADFTTPDGFGIGADAWFAEKAAADAAAAAAEKAAAEKATADQAAADQAAADQAAVDAAADAAAEAAAQPQEVTE